MNRIFIKGLPGGAKMARINEAPRQGVVDGHTFKRVGDELHVTNDDGEFIVMAKDDVQKQLEYARLIIALFE